MKKLKTAIEEMRAEYQAEALRLTPEQEAELDARYADYLAHPSVGESWHAVKSQILQSR